MINKIFKNSAVKNMSWIMIGKICQSILSLLISLLTARFLGPANFGIINYALAVTTFLIPIMQLGFNNVLVFELQNNKEEEGKIIGTALILSSISSLFCIVCCTSFVMFANYGEKETILITILCSMLLFFQAFDLLQYWFQSKLLSKYSSIASLIAYAVVAGYRIFLLATKSDIIWFALTSSFDYLLIAILLLIFYKRKGGQKLSFSKAVGARMFSSSKHYIFAGLMAVIYGQIDKIMLKLIIGDDETGLYSIAISFANILGFVFSAIIDSIRPVIFQHKKAGNKEKYEKTISVLYHIIAYLGLIQGLVMTLFAEPLIQLLYGDEYISAAGALRFLCWYISFSYFGSIRNIWLLSEQKQKYLWIINLTGAVLSFTLNLLLIPLIQAQGAAIASLTTQFVCNFVLGFIIKPIRGNNSLLIKGLNPMCLVKFWRTKNEKD